MLALFANEEHIKKVRDNPKAMHWSQSTLEKVTDAEILSEGIDYILTKTRFLAPVMIRPSPYRTEYLGETFRTITQAEQDARSGDGEAYWTEIVKQSKESMRLNYGKNGVLHEDYTLWWSGKEARVFVNLRHYPKGSFFVDLIIASLEIGDRDLENLSEVSRGSIRDGFSYALKPKQRTMTLDEMIGNNRMETVILIKPEGELRYKISSLNDIDNLNYAGVSGTEKVRMDFLNEVALQNRLLFFKMILDECSVHYRR